MEKLEVKCQVRADLSSPLPEVLLGADIRNELTTRFSFTGRAADDTRSEVARLLARAGARPVEDLAGVIMAQRRRQHVDLYGGTYAQRGGGTYIIENLTVAPESLYVRAGAETDVCMDILKETAEIVDLHLAGRTNLRSAIEGYAYATDSRVKLAFRIESLLSQPLRDLIKKLEDSVRGGGDADNVTIVIHPWDLDFKVHRWDLSGAMPKVDRWNFRIYHEEFKHHDHSIYSIESLLGSADHFALIESLEKMVEDAGG